MAERTPYLLRIDPELMAALKHWAADDLRSLNAQIEFILRRAVVAERRLPERGREPAARGAEEPGLEDAG
jgi:hypothetical protein